MFVGNVWATAPKREFRSAWIATVANIDWPSQKGTSTSIITQQKNDLTAMLDRMVELNMTTVCFQVRSMSDALYESSYEPWADQMTGTRGQYPGWDPLAFAVEECHKRGIEIYAWVNPFRWSNKDVSAATWNTSFDQEVKSKGWLLSNGSYTVMNPALPDVRAHIVKVCKEIITKYSVEGCSAFFSFLLQLSSCSVVFISKPLIWEVTLFVYIIYIIGVIFVILVRIYT